MAAYTVTPLPPSFSTKLETHDDGVVLKCCGRLTSECSEDFRLQIKKLLPQFARLRVDMSGVPYIDSSGLGALIAAYVSAKTAGGEIQLVNLHERVSRLLRTTHLASVLDPYNGPSDSQT